MRWFALVVSASAACMGASYALQEKWASAAAAAVQGFRSGER